MTDAQSDHLVRELEDLHHGDTEKGEERAAISATMQKYNKDGQKLPNELLASIFEYVVDLDKTMLHTLVRLSRAWYAQLNPILYRCPHLEDRLQMFRFATTLSEESAAEDEKREPEGSHRGTTLSRPRLATHVAELSFGFKRVTCEASSYLDGSNADLACAAVDRCRRSGHHRLHRGLFRAHGDGAFKSGLASLCIGSLKELTVAGLNEKALGAVVQALNVPPMATQPSARDYESAGTTAPPPPVQVTRVCMSGDVVRSMGVRIEEKRLRSGDIICRLEDETQLRRLHITSISEDIFKHMRVPISNLTHLVLSLPSTKGAYSDPLQPGAGLGGRYGANGGHHHLPSSRLLSRFLILQTLGPKVRPTRDIIEAEVAALHAHSSVELERTMAGNRIFLQFRRLERLIVMADACLLRYIMTELAPLDDDRLRFRVAKDVRGERVWQGPLSCDDLEAGVAAEWYRASSYSSTVPLPKTKHSEARCQGDGTRKEMAMEEDEEALQAPWKDEDEDLLGATSTSIAELSRRIDARGSGQPDFWSMGGATLGYGGW